MMFQLELKVEHQTEQCLPQPITCTKYNAAGTNPRCTSNSCKTCHTDSQAGQTGHTRKGNKGREHQVIKWCEGSTDQQHLSNNITHSLSMQMEQNMQSNSNRRPQHASKLPSIQHRVQYSVEPQGLNNPTSTCWSRTC